MRSSDMHPAACPACRGRLEAWLSVAASEPSLAGPNFSLVRCVVCGPPPPRARPRLTCTTRELSAPGGHGGTEWHVLEHLQEPGPALERIRGWLRPGGALLVGVPNLASLQARIARERWYHLDVPRHRTHFTADGLARLLAACGFEVVAVRQLLLEHNPYGMWQSAVNRLTRHPSYLYNLLKRNAPLDARDLAVTLLALTLLPVAVVAELAAGLAGRGGTIAVLARHRD